jgi:hypothetical protein
MSNIDKEGERRGEIEGRNKEERWGRKAEEKHRWRDRKVRHERDSGEEAHRTRRKGREPEGIPR